MAKSKKNRKPPSRTRYEQTHRVSSARLDEETTKELREHLARTRCSFANFVKGALGKEKEMVRKRIDMLASRELNPLVEDRLMCLEDLLHQVLLMTCVLFMAVNEDDWPPDCPHCDNQRLIRCEGRETESSLAHHWVITWKCRRCGFFVNTYKRIDPKSIQYSDT